MDQTKNPSMLPAHSIKDRNEVNRTRDCGPNETRPRDHMYLSYRVTESRHTMDPLTLTAQLNTLLQAIDLPFVLTSPVDLTPSLLITIFESITQVPIPIAHAIDQEDESRHIQTIKVFIGVVELDFLQLDIGLSSLDPRLLAAGAWDEVVFVAEALCWIGEELDLIQPVPVVDKGRAQDQVKKQGSSPMLHPIPRAPTPSPSSTITFLPPFSPPPTPTTTTLLFSTDMEDRTLQMNIASPLTTSPSLRQPSTSYHSSPYKCSDPKPKPRSAYLSPSHTAASPCVSNLRPSSHRSVSTHDTPRDDFSFSPSVRRRTGHNPSVGHQAELSSPLEYSRSSSTSTRRRHKSPTKSHHETFAIPTYSSEFLASALPSQRTSGSKDWRRLFLDLPGRNPRRTYEFLEQLLRTRMSRWRPFCIVCFLSLPGIYRYLCRYFVWLLDCFILLDYQTCGPLSVLLIFMLLIWVSSFSSAFSKLYNNFEVKFMAKALGASEWLYTD